MRKECLTSRLIEEICIKAISQFSTIMLTKVLKYYNNTDKVTEKNTLDITF